VELRQLREFTRRQPRSYDRAGMWPVLAVTDPLHRPEREYKEKRSGILRECWQTRKLVD
jgi:hypothetical protein